MKTSTRILCLGLTLLMPAAFMLGCSSGSSASEAASGSGVSGNQQGGQRAAMTLAEGQTEVFGKVTKIAGNSVELALGEIKGDMPQMPEGGSGFGGGSMPSMPEGGDSKSADGSRPNRENGSMPEGGSRPNRGDGSMPSGDGAKRGGMGGFSVEFTASGETKTITVPVGMTISGMGQSSSDFSSITEGSVLRVVMKDEAVVSIMMFSSKTGAAESSSAE